jgi:S2P endopeptidase
MQIPGWTIPLSHLPALLLTLFINQTIHEAGHLLAAAVDGIKPLRVSVSVWLGLVSAGVAFGEEVEEAKRCE